MEHLPVQPQTTPLSRPRDPDEINLLEYIYALVKHKKLIIGLTLLGIVGGYVAALVKGPMWVAEAMIAPKERESQKSTSLADLGALGGLVASQLNLDQGSASLNTMEMILDSRDFGAKLIEKDSLLPFIYKYQWPGKYKKYWDQSRNTWKPNFVKPNPLAMGGFIKKKYVKKTKDTKKNVIVLTIQTKDSAFTSTFATTYMDYLNEYIRTKVQTEAKENVAYLDSELVNIADPLLRTKILGLLASEIEKEMVVSREAFKVADPLYIHKTFKEKRLLPLVFGVGLFFLSCVIIVFIHAFSTFDKTEEERDLIEKIIKELDLLPARKK
ncbi:MAG TPA: Wzz/FepE/Etk N-terminal domain-containing protein [Chitinivibrionales bacterium]|nr:Wzz/FepE/Etk N-terminal domain-containing protein [Chitinivibrionales bacterium]